MSAITLLKDLRARGIELIADGDLLRYRAPRRVLTPELRQVLTHNKAELLAELKAELAQAELDVIEAELGGMNTCLLQLLAKGDRDAAAELYGRIQAIVVDTWHPARVRWAWAQHAAGQLDETWTFLLEDRRGQAHREGAATCRPQGGRDMTRLWDRQLGGQGSTKVWQRWGNRERLAEFLLRTDRERHFNRLPRDHHGEVPGAMSSGKRAAAGFILTGWDSWCPGQGLAGCSSVPRQLAEWPRSPILPPAAGAHSLEEAHMTDTLERQRAKFERLVDDLLPEPAETHDHAEKRLGTRGASHHYVRR